MKKTEAITRIRNRFRKRPEWLLIQVVKMDEETTTPLVGRLLAHSPDREAIYRRSAQIRGGFLMIEHSSPSLPPEHYAFAF